MLFWKSKFQIYILFFSFVPVVGLCEKSGENSPLFSDPGTSLNFPGTNALFSSPEFGDINYSAVITGFGMSQNNPVAGNPGSILDISNAQFVLQKDTGLLQFYIQAGYYSTPSLGSSYQRSNIQTTESFGFIPLAFVSVPIGENWTISAGKLNSFGGYENTFTYENLNIDRGLLWNQTSNVSKGVQVNYKKDRLQGGATLNDGFYGNQLNWMGAYVAYAVDGNSNVSLSWTGAIKTSPKDTFITPLAQNNSQIFNAIYTYKSSRWFFAPNLQYTFVPENASVGIFGNAQTIGAALLGNYYFSNSGSASGKFTLPFRLEYIASSKGAGMISPNLLYGQGSSAWSGTVTPTYQYRNYFFRAEASYVQAINVVAGMGFGRLGNASNQVRFMFELGFMY